MVDRHKGAGRHELDCNSSLSRRVSVSVAGDVLNAHCSIYYGC